MGEQIETVIIGAGQAGLATSYYLSQLGREHMILERTNGAASVWQNERWDSFTLVTPNWSFRLPGAEYQGHEPDGFLARDELVNTFEGYLERFRFPIRYNVEVTSIHHRPHGIGYLLQSEQGSLEARNVVIATGLYQRPKVPSFTVDIPIKIFQLHSSQYRNPEALPEGAVLVVGSAQSGCQIAEELYKHGHKVYLCVGGAGRVPRKYRGKDIYEWMHRFGYLDRKVEMLRSPEERFAPLQHVSGANGGHTLNLHQFARDGVSLLGRLVGGGGNYLRLAGDLKKNLAQADKIETDLIKLIDERIVLERIDVPRERLPVLRDGFNCEETLDLDLRASGIKTIIWANGYSFDYRLVRFPVTDRFGFPIQKRGVTTYPGLFFVGMPWLYKQKSGTFLGVGEDAEYIAGVIASIR